MTVNFADMVDRERVTKNNNDPANPLTYDDDYELNIPTVYTLIVRGDSNDVLELAAPRPPSTPMATTSTSATSSPLPTRSMVASSTSTP